MDSDEALFQRWVAGDLKAFDRLYGRYERPIFGFICAQLGDATEAEDVLQQVFVAVLHERSRVGQLRSLRAWMFEIARNLCRNRVRSRKRAGRATFEVSNTQAVATPPQGAEEHLERHEQLVHLQRAVARLPLRLAEIYRLRAAGLSYEELADVLKLPLGTVKSHIHEMVQCLKQEVPR
jgi:RNA polymerase sigma-70 factor (ECF subfamily)